MKKLNRAQKCSILGPQNLGSRGGPAPSRIRAWVVAGSRHVTSINGFLLLLQESLSALPCNLQAEV